MCDGSCSDTELPVSIKSSKSVRPFLFIIFYSLHVVTLDALGCVDNLVSVVILGIVFQINFISYCTGAFCNTEAVAYLVIIVNHR